MIKCGDKLEGKPQCILYSKDGSKVLGRFLYSKHGGEKGAKAAAHKREGQIQAFKQKHQGLLDALDAFGAPAVLKYVLAADGESCEEVVKAHVADWLEKARGEGQSAEKPEAEVEVGVEKKKKRPSFKTVWETKYGGSVTKCIEKLKGKVTNPAAYCAYLKDKATGTTKWRGKEKKSFDETAEEALRMLQKDESDEMELDNIDLKELEAWLAGEVEEAADLSAQAGVETEPTGDTEPEPASDVEPEPAEPEPEPEVVEEQPLDFHTFLLREHARRREDILAMMGEEVEDA